MSSLGHQASDATKDKKSEPSSSRQLQSTVLPTQQAARLVELMSQPENLLKAAGLPTGVKQSLTSRPIAPATGIVAAAGKLPQHALVSKAAVGGSLEAVNLQAAGGLPGSQTVPVNLSTQPAPSKPSSQAVHIAMTTVSSQPIHSLTLPAALGHATAAGIVQAQAYTTQVTVAGDTKDKARVTVMAPGATISDQDRTRTLPMSSLIRGGMAQTPTQVSLALAQAQAHPTSTSQGPGTPSQASIIHALPHQHIPRGPAAASALAATKVGTVLRTQAVSSAAQVPSNNPLLPTIGGHLQARAQFPVRGATPTVTHMVTTAAVSGFSQADIQRQAQAHLMTTLSAGSQAVQISGLQGRPVLSQVQAKGITVPQAFSQQAQKVVVPQSMSQILTQGSGGPTLVSVTAPRLTGQALNLAAQQGATRTQKVISTQAGHLPTQTQVSLATNLGGAQTLNLGQTLQRGQKVVVSQTNITANIPPGAVVVNTTPKIGHQGINISQTMQRPQKVVVSQVSANTVMPPTVPMTIATLSKPMAALGVHGNQVSQISSVSTPTTITTTNVASLPFNKRNISRHPVKVQPPRMAQPQVAMATVPQQVDHSHPSQHRDNTAPHPVKPPVAQPPVISTPQIQTGLYGLAGPAQSRPMGTVNQVTLAVTMATTGNVQAVTQADSRPQGQERPTLPHQFNLAEYTNLLQSGLQPYNLVYPNVRPGLVQGQQANLAASLQAATPSQAITTITATQSAVRLNPSVMVSVDPTPHGAISLATAQLAVSKPAEVPPTTVSMAPAGAASHTTNPVPTTVSHGTHPTNQQHGGGASQPTNSSPRPSILRKRPHDGERVMIVKRNLISSVNAADSSTNGSVGDAGMHSLSSTASPKPPTNCDPTRENSQSSTDTASSAESTTQSGTPSEVKVKQEPLDAIENGAAAGLTMFSQLQNNVEASPRKKPRKQRLNATEEIKDRNSSDEELDTLAEEDIKQELEWEAEEREKKAAAAAAMSAFPPDLKEFTDEEGVKWTRERSRPAVSLMNHYSCTWKPKNNHFQRYQDIKPKEERRPTVNELANQKAIHQKASGWKIYHLAAQLEELMDMEQSVFRSMSVVQDSIAPKHIAKNPTMEDDISMVHELTQGNIQRCQLVMDQLEEAKSSMIKVLDHKQRILDIINKHHSKRPVKKKERP